MIPDPGSRARSLLVGLATLVAACSAQDGSLRPDWVADQAGLLSDVEETELRGMLVALEERTSVRLVNVLVPSLESRSIAGFSQSVAAEWGLAEAPLNNYIVFSVAMEERLRHVEAGIGMRWSLPEAFVDSLMVATAPHFADGSYLEGILETLEPIISLIDTVQWRAAFYDLAEVGAAAKHAAGRVASFEATIVALEEDALHVSGSGVRASILIGPTAAPGPLSVDDVRIFHARVRRAQPPVLLLLGLEEI